MFAGIMDGVVPYNMLYHIYFSWFQTTAIFHKEEFQNLGLGFSFSSSPGPQIFEYSLSWV